MGNDSSKNSKPRRKSTGNIQSSPNMSMIRRQSIDSKKKTEHKLYLARENPEPVFDLSDCGLYDVPTGVFQVVKTLQKQALLLNDNFLHFLEPGGSLNFLSELQILDLHSNQFSQLPEELGLLCSLQALNLENNLLKKLPKSISKLQNLEVLNLKGNRFKFLPAALASLKNLKTLDISSNQVTVLPKDFAQLFNLVSLLLDSRSMVFPPFEVCKNGTEDIKQYLCMETGTTYVPITDEAANSFSLDAVQLLENFKMSNTFESTKKNKQRVFEILEKELEESQRIQNEISAKSAVQRKRFFNILTQEQIKQHGQISDLQRIKDENRQALFEIMKEEEKQVEELVSSLASMNEKAKKAERLAEQMEQERIQNEQLFLVRQEELENLRRKEVLAAMQRILSDAEAFDQMWTTLTNNKEILIKQTQSNSMEAENKLENVLLNRQKDQSKLYLDLQVQEQLQKEAFESLMQQRDSCHQRLSKQIELIEEELGKLTLLEIEQREMRLDNQRNVLNDKREELASMLVLLMKERDVRAEELNKRLIEMEESREETIKDYWLIQYQRLMDRKPQSLIDEENHMELAVIEILEKSEANDYITNFSRHRITIETLLQMSEKDLKDIGIHEAGLRKNILTNISFYRANLPIDKFVNSIPSKSKVTPSSPKMKVDLNEPEKKPESEKPCTSSKEIVNSGVVPSAPENLETPKELASEVTARGFNSECVVCLSETSCVLFLNCGHVCSCIPCSHPLIDCPMCRAPIQRKITVRLHSDSTLHDS